jgi:hypothetical protein
MSIIVQSGATSDLLTIDATSKAARVTGYDSAGNELIKPPTASYLMAVPVGRDTAARTAAGAFFAIRNNTSGRTIYIRRIVMTATFDGTGAATTSRLDLARFSGATPSGGTAITLPGGAIKKRNSYGSSNLLDARFITGTAGGLTMAGTTVETAFACFGVARGATGGSATFIQEFGSAGAYPTDRFELATGEGLCVLAGVTGVIGDGFIGSIEWDEI